MSDRSDEFVEADRGERSTDELLEETERLLSGSNAEADADSSADASAGTSTDTASTDTESAKRTSLRSRLPSLPRLSLETAFSPKAFLALVGALGVGFFAGELVIPIAGQIVGMLAVAFAIGLATSKRRYLEVGAAGAAVGGVAAVVSNAVLAVAGSGRAVLAVGVTAGLVACLVGYYFGRDLRNGLFQEIE
ncbi:DUF456 domain-containing protein [Natronococcus sp. A-GB7]|uniref:DUF456 domain-containing protein n=1 Tax=Natronococcus sp. A-GB7 TaxID=3037649 RepID=UPI00241EDC9C|nr:DUF456 domain-containing protein [Natronococcus sp. A-GB7]MDG5817842.1 DUF456 domain-containing protein [Natronococcus sp. A-GB7]